MEKSDQMTMMLALDCEPLCYREQKRKKNDHFKQLFQTILLEIDLKNIYRFSIRAKHALWLCAAALFPEVRRGKIFCFQPPLRSFTYKYDNEKFPAPNETLGVVSSFSIVIQDSQGNVLAFPPRSIPSPS